MLFETSKELNQYIAKIGKGTAILSFSTGKDSIAAWLEMRKYFDKIVPYYLYPIPGLSFIEKSLTYYEDFFKTRIIRLPHPSLYRMINALMFQAPENCAVIEEMGLPDFDYDTLAQIIKEDYGLDPNTTYVASGVRARDSLNRWTAIKKYGPVNESRKSFFPIFDFTKADMVKTLLAGNVKLPVDYRMFGRSFDGMDFRFLGPIRKYYPDDYEKILAFFPLVELELRRIEYRASYYSNLGEVQNG